MNRARANPAASPSQFEPANRTQETSDNNEADFIEGHFVELRYTLSFLNEKINYLTSDLVTCDDIQKQLLQILGSIEQASDSYQRWLGSLVHPDLPLTLQEDHSTVSSDGYVHQHVLSISTKFMKSVGHVLRTEVLEKDLSGILSKIAPLPGHLACLKEEAPQLYNFVELGHSRENLPRLHDTIVGNCQEKFEKILGTSSFDCEYFLKETVVATIQLRSRLLHPDILFDYSDAAEVFQARGMAILKGSDRHVILPSVRARQRVIAKAMAYYNRADCDICLQQKGCGRCKSAW